MVLNYIEEQIASGQIEARKIYGKLNNADMHTKPFRKDGTQDPWPAGPTTRYYSYFSIYPTSGK
jgi:hypothetical protein